MSLHRARWRLLLLNLGCLLLLLLLVCAGAYGLLRHQLYERLQRDLLLTAHAVTFSVENEPHGVDFHESIYVSDRKVKVDLDELDADTAERYAAEGQFGSGSMQPKVLAAVEYVRGGPGRRAVIGSLERAPEAMAGRSGTVIHR